MGRGDFLDIKEKKKEWLRKKVVTQGLKDYTSCAAKKNPDATRGRGREAKNAREKDHRFLQGRSISKSRTDGSIN